MKKNIHPTYYPNAKISCACGAEFEVGATEEHIKVEICSNCHPFYTGKQKIVDTARRIEKYQTRVAQKTEVSKTRKGRTIKRTAKKIKRASKTKTAKAEE
jgi:large subunit ribosomal protein L31